MPNHGRIQALAMICSSAALKRCGLRGSDADYAAAAAVLSEGRVSAVTRLSTVMNVFNRVAIMSR
jgi:hypothetical protein